MNILLINHYAGSPQHGMEYRPYYLAKEWGKKGHKVTILAASYSHIRTYQPKMGINQTKDELIDGIHYRWYDTPQHSGNGLGRARNILTFLKRILTDTNHIVNHFKPDIVIASSTYPMDIWSAHKIAKKANAQLIYEVHDLWPLSPIELGGMSRWNPFIIWCQISENYACRNSDKVISMLPKTQPHLEYHGMKPENFFYIPNGIVVDEKDSRTSLPQNIEREMMRIKKRNLPIVGYAGTYGLANALDLILDAAKHAQNDFEVVMVGTGPNHNKLLQRVEVENIRNVTIFSAIPKASIPTFLQEIDIAYIGLLPQPLFRFGISPNKLMDYMCAAKPIVMAINAGNNPVTEAGCGITASPSDASSIRDAIFKLSQLAPEERRKMGEDGRKYILKNQTYPILAHKFIEILKK